MGRVRKRGAYEFGSIGNNNIFSSIGVCTHVGLGIRARKLKAFRKSKGKEDCGRVCV